MSNIEYIHSNTSFSEENYPIVLFTPIILPMILMDLSNEDSSYFTKITVTTTVNNNES